MKWGATEKFLFLNSLINIHLIRDRRNFEKMVRMIKSDEEKSRLIFKANADRYFTKTLRLRQLLRVNKLSLVWGQL